MRTGDAGRSRVAAAVSWIDYNMGALRCDRRSQRGRWRDGGSEVRLDLRDKVAGDVNGPGDLLDDPNRPDGFAVDEESPAVVSEDQDRVAIAPEDRERIILLIDAKAESSRQLLDGDGLLVTDQARYTGPRAFAAGNDQKRQ